MPRPLQLRFVTSADRYERLPPTEAEVAIVGRSNVGKSSLVNALSGRKGLAHTSKTPGRTRLLNLFTIDDGNQNPHTTRGVVDLPGYGYAAVSKQQKAGWSEMIERYLTDRDSLQMVIALVDGAVGPTKLDVTMLDWLRGHDIPHTVVATKHDKVRSSHHQRRARDLAAGCQLEPGDVIWVSAEKNTGIDRLRHLITTWLTP